MQLKFLNQFISQNTGLLIRFDDICENMKWNFMENCESLFDELKIKPVLGVIPNNQDKELLKYKQKNNFWDIVRNWQNKGWTIAMHGNTHVYDSDTHKKDFFNYGGRSEFFGHPLNEQINRINLGLKKFKDERVNVRVFFAPNHTYDQNTFEALKKCGLYEVIDGYGLKPYRYLNIKFIPQLFYKNIMLPYGIQSTQIHLNYWDEQDFEVFKKFIIKNKKKIISYEEAIQKVSNNIINLSFNFVLEKTLKIIRLL